MNNQNLVLFESKQVRRFYDSEKDVWYFSLVDIVQALTGSINPTDYLKKLRKRDNELGLFLGTNCPPVSAKLKRWLFSEGLSDYYFVHINKNTSFV